MHTLLLQRHPLLRPIIFLALWAWAVVPTAGRAQSLEDVNALIFQRVSALVAQTGQPEARYHLGMMLHRGIGTAKDPVQAYAHFTAAAEAGHALAAYQAGGYLSGLYTGAAETDLKRAEQYWRQSAEAGYDLAQRDVAQLMMRRGDIAGALVWLEAASRQGQEDWATAVLADRHSREGATERYKGYALMLLLKAKTASPQPAMLARLAQVEPTLSEQDIQKATELLGNWVTGPTAVTLQARQGMGALMPLLRQAQ